jgi:hypothetical protein
MSVNVKSNVLTGGLYEIQETMTPKEMLFIIIKPITLALYRLKNRSTASDSEMSSCFAHWV